VTPDLDPDEDDLRCPRCECVHILGVEVRGKYDGILYWECPDCEHTWHRWPEGHYLRTRADPYVREHEDEAEVTA
jgi:hypothetical protein